MVDEYFELPIGDTPVPPAIVAHVPNDLNGPSCPVSIAQDAPSTSHSPTSSYILSPSVHQGTAVDDSFEVNSFPPPNDVPFDNTLAPEFSSEASSSGDLDTATSVPNPLPHEQSENWNNDHLFENMFGNPS